MSLGKAPHPCQRRGGPPSMLPLSGRGRSLRLSRLGGLGRHGVLRRLRRPTSLALRALLLGLALRRFLGPLLVELHAPLGLVGLLQPKLGAEGAPSTRPEAGHSLFSASY